MLKTKAISEEQKALRRNAIIQSARELFHESRFQTVNMQDVATRAGMAKGTVFFYFKTKEELFLAYAKEEIFRWNDRFDEILHEYRENRDSENFNVDDFIEVIIKSLGDDKVFIQLISILGGVLEHNVDFDVMLSYKKSVLGRMMKTGKVIEEIIPGFKPNDGIKLYLYAFFIVAGIYPMAEPSETVKKVIEVPGMEFFSIDFNQTFKELMSKVLRGWK